VAGSCLGGSASGAYQFIHETGYIPYDTCQPYLACSQDSNLGFCPYTNTSCSAFTTCRTCTMKLVPSLHPFGELCREIDHFPNATVAEYGTITLNEEHGVAINVMNKVKAEIFSRGPVAAAINGAALHHYRGGIIDDINASKNVTHAVSIIGWDVDTNDGSTHYIVRNSWGEYFGGTSFAALYSTRWYFLDYISKIASSTFFRNGFLSDQSGGEYPWYRRGNCLGNSRSIYSYELSM
jgi:cathepsin X